MPGFLDKVKSGISEKAMEASIRSREAVEASQIKSRIGDLEIQKRKAFSELGQAVHAMFLSNSFDQAALAAQSEAIAALEAQIKQKELDLEEVHRRAEQQIAEQRAVEAKQASTGAACPGCGRTLQAGARFCPGCGAKLG